MTNGASWRLGLYAATVAVRSESVKFRVVPQEAVWRPGLKMWSGFMVCALS